MDGVESMHTDAIDPDRLVLIVTGSSLRAEAEDRPLAYALRDRLLMERDKQTGRAGDDPPFDALICSDIWRLNTDSLRGCPTISVGGPDVNALTAYLTDKIDSAYVVEDALMVQVDLDFADLRACCWGVDRARTAKAVDSFAEKYLDAYVKAIVQGVDARSDE